MLVGETHTRIQTTVAELPARHHPVQSNKKGSIRVICPQNRDDRRQGRAGLSPGEKDHQAYLQRCQNRQQ